MEVLKNIQEILNTISEESQSLVFKKCEEHGFNPDRGIISLKESFINLNQTRDILSDAIQKQKLNQLPLTIQKSISGNLENIKTLQSNLINGSDEVVNLVDSIEQLYANIWIYRLNNMSDELLGYSTKMNQLKDQEVKVHDLQRELEKGLDLKGQLDGLLAQIQKSSENAQGTLGKIDTTVQEVNANAEKILKATQDSGTHLSSTTQNDQNITQLLANSKTSSSEIVAIEGKIKDFFASIESYKNEIDQSKAVAKSTIEKNNTDTKGLIKNLKDLEDQIKDQITRATGHSLFHSFQTRQEALRRSKGTWVYALDLSY